MWIGNKIFLVLYCDPASILFRVIIKASLSKAHRSKFVDLYFIKKPFFSLFILPKPDSLTTLSSCDILFLIW
uniref:Uncharacterized protein n=1 Tax=Klebsiella pneumoniae TaxID=573 RepID=A0A8B0SXT7_KLEPN|nr:hypothetical protein [Klebsiella pneumoniae]